MNAAVDRIETDDLLMNKVKLKILYVFLCLSGMMLSILPVRAEESSYMPPHLTGGPWIAGMPGIRGTGL